MSRSARIASGLAALTVWAGALAAAGFRLPPEQMPAGEGDAALVRTHCAACHSLDYATTQPPSRDRAFWDAEVAKMRDVYGAPIPADAAPRIAAWLTAAQPGR